MDADRVFRVNPSEGEAERRDDREDVLPDDAAELGVFTNLVEV